MGVLLGFVLRFLFSEDGANFLDDFLDQLWVGGVDGRYFYVVGFCK